MPSYRERKHVLFCADFIAAGVLQAADCCCCCHTGGACEEPRSSFPPHRPGVMPPLLTLVYAHLCCHARRQALDRAAWAKALASVRHQSRKPKG